jgi:hypothetical protein
VIALDLRGYGETDKYIRPRQARDGNGLVRVDVRIESIEDRVSGSRSRRSCRQLASPRITRKFSTVWP